MPDAIPAIPVTTTLPEPTVPKPTVFILGPSLDNVFEPVPVTTEPTGPVVAGRRQVTFRSPATTPGGNVHLQVLPPLKPNDATPVNVYAVFVQPIASLPAPESRTPDWFFKSGAPSGSVPIGIADPVTGAFTIVVKGVTPSLQPFFVQTILEFTVS